MGMGARVVIKMLKPMMPICRELIRIGFNPGNKWAWYELFKKGYTLEQAIWLAKQKGWNKEAVINGYKEFER